MAGIDSYPMFFAGFKYQKRQEPQKGKGTVGQVHQRQAEFDLDQTIEY